MNVSIVYINKRPTVILTGSPGLFVGRTISLVPIAASSEISMFSSGCKKIKGALIAPLDEGPYPARDTMRVAKAYLSELSSCVAYTKQKFQLYNSSYLYNTLGSGVAKDSYDLKPQ